MRNQYSGVLTVSAEFVPSIGLLSSNQEATKAGIQNRLCVIGWSCSRAGPSYRLVGRKGLALGVCVWMGAGGWRRWDVGWKCYSQIV